ncbi:MAG TPA: HEAT repeat domain-containing protein, partial [Gemmataceae bacterium]|nr:HEAT repeat domain-containing protein [Gemmataceae bacterium]
MNGFSQRLPQWLLLAAAVGILGAALDRACAEDKAPAKEKIDKLIRQLGSPKFSEREAASKALEEIGELALDTLREAAAKNKDIEIRRRAQELAGKIVDRNLDKTLAKMLAEGIDPEKIYKKMTKDGALEEKVLDGMFKEGIRRETKGNFKRAYELLRAVEKLATDRWQARNKTPVDDPFITEVCLHVARTSRKLGDYDEAARAYDRAAYFSNYDANKRKEIGRECCEMTDALLPGWEKTVKDKIDKDPSLKKLVAKYPLIVLHSRRYTGGGGYHRCCYSFKHETWEENVHGNDVQLQFDNNRAEMFEVNMIGGQKNRVAALGAVDFDKVVVPQKTDFDDEKTWLPRNCKA